MFCSKLVIQRIKDKEPKVHSIVMEKRRYYETAE